MTIQTLTVSLSHPIQRHQIPRWRGAFLEMIGWDEELFHNHANKGYQGKGTYASTQTKRSGHHYRYPLIQYYENGAKGMVLGIQEGAIALDKIIHQKELSIRWNGRQERIEIENIKVGQHRFQMLPQPKTYHLHRWLALTQKNYTQWLDCANLQERIALLDRLLVNHLIGLFKELQWNWPARLEANLQFLHHTERVRFKGLALTAFDVSFTANVDLPIGIGIGKGVSQGYGTLRK